MGDKFADLVQNLDFWTQELGKCLLTRSKLDRSHLPNLKKYTIPIKVNKFVHWNQYQRWDGQNLSSCGVCLVALEVGFGGSWRGAQVPTHAPQP